jgi:hypothetical protein
MLSVKYFLIKDLFLTLFLTLNPLINLLGLININSKLIKFKAIINPMHFRKNLEMLCIIKLLKSKNSKIGFFLYLINKLTRIKLTLLTNH